MKKETLSEDGWFLRKEEAKEPPSRLPEEAIAWIKQMSKILETPSA